MSRNSIGWRQKKGLAPPIPTKRSGYKILEHYQILENGHQFLLYNSSEDDQKTILIFTPRAGLENLRNNKKWACDGTIK